MGANIPKSELDQAYRALVSRFLRDLMASHTLNKTELAAKLGVDRATASRYLSEKVRTPLQRLFYLQRTIREYVPREIEEAFWASEASADAAPSPAPPPAPAPIRKAG